MFQKNHTNWIHLFSLFSIQLSLSQNGGASLLEVWGLSAGSHCCVCNSGGRKATLTWPPSLRQGSETDRMYLVDWTVLKVKGVINSQKPNSSWRLPDFSTGLFLLDAQRQSSERTRCATDITGGWCFSAGFNFRVD